MPLTLGVADFQVRVTVPERKTGVGIQGGASEFAHIFDWFTRYEVGTGSNKVNAVYSKEEHALSATDLDLRGTLASVLDGSAVTFPIVTGIFFKNLSTTTGQYVTIGGSTNPFITWLAATGDGIRVGPGGFFMLWAPLDGYATTSGTADILTFTPATGTPTCSYMILGRSS